MERFNQNSFFSRSFFSSEFLSPDFLPGKLFGYFEDAFYFFTDDKFISYSKAALAFFSIFFITIICYTTVRMFEIRKKEKKHLEHEIREYAHNKMEYEKKLKETTGGSKNEKW